LGQGWAWRAIIDFVVFRTINVVAVPRLGSIVKILILSLALEIFREFILAGCPQNPASKSAAEMWVQSTRC
jgi:hypothetical protein